MGVLGIWRTLSSRKTGGMRGVCPTSSYRDLSDGFRRTRVSRVSPRWCRLRWPRSNGAHATTQVQPVQSHILPLCVTFGSTKFPREPTQGSEGTWCSCRLE
jgi:hypothetical protein